MILSLLIVLRITYSLGYSLPLWRFHVHLKIIGVAIVLWSILWMSIKFHLIDSVFQFLYILSNILSTVLLIIEEYWCLLLYLHYLPIFPVSFISFCLCVLWLCYLEPSHLELECLLGESHLCDYVLCCLPIIFFVLKHTLFNTDVATSHQNPWVSETLFFLQANR